MNYKRLKEKKKYCKIDNNNQPQAQIDRCVNEQVNVIISRLSSVK